MLFRSEDEIDIWRQSEGRARGAVLALPQVWDLSRRWYGDRLAASFRGRTAAGAIQIFQALGLKDGFWTVPPS